MREHNPHPGCGHPGAESYRAERGCGAEGYDGQRRPAHRYPEASSQREMIPAPCLVGMIRARNGVKPRMPRFGTEQMRYMRSRPWRSRGPWFDNRAGARRRGRRADELVLAASDELQDSVLPVGLEDVEAENVLLAGAPAWPIPAVPAAWVAHDPASLLATNGPGNDRLRSRSTSWQRRSPRRISCRR